MKFQINEKNIYYVAAGLTALLFLLVLFAPGVTKKEQKTVEEPQDVSQLAKTESEQTVAPAQADAGIEPCGNPQIRVLLKTNGFKNEVHTEVQLSCAGGMIAEYGAETAEYAPEEAAAFSPDHAFFQNGNIRIRPKTDGDKIQILSLKRGYGVPAYRGVLELQTTAEGIAVINELPLEQYLYGVVPSEMPSSYETEALKCQAVCARSYAFCQMQQMGYPEYQANVDDSTSYQVYGNSQEADSTIQAVDATAGQRIVYGGQVVNAYYYSTSCGQTTDMSAWGSEVNDGNAYLQNVAVTGEQGDFEKDLAWYRWEAAIERTVLSNLIGLNTGTDIGTVQTLEVTQTGAGGIALKITAAGDKGSVTVETENKIRRALGNGGYTITKQDGSEIEVGALLPSAFFTVEVQGDTFLLHGGGFGHGIGMSQNGANEMAKQGKTCEEILKTFYQGIAIG